MIGLKPLSNQMSQKQQCHNTWKILTSWDMPAIMRYEDLSMVNVDRCFAPKTDKS